MPNRALIIILGGLVLIGGAGALYFLTRATEKAPAVAPAAATPTLRPTPTAAAPTPTRSPEPKPLRPEPPPTPAAPTMGTLIFESDVPDTGVFIDRVFVGTAPVTAKDIKPGPHTVNFSATGYEGQVESIDVEPGTRTISIKFKEIRLNASVTAVHKHAIGSCTGTLKATPEGLTYETANKGDAFTVPLTTLDAFEMDYLAKTLRLKIKNGKSYNFTEPDGKAADRLYAFHKEVESARQRLLKGR